MTNRSQNILEDASALPRTLGRSSILFIALVDLCADSNELRWRWRLLEGLEGLRATASSVAAMYSDAGSGSCGSSDMSSSSRKDSVSTWAPRRWVRLSSRL